MKERSRGKPKQRLLAIRGCQIDVAYNASTPGGLQGVRGGGSADWIGLPKNAANEQHQPQIRTTPSLGIMPQQL